MKLEIKHLAPYLPYGVKVINNTHPDDVNLVTGLRDETYFIEQNSRYAYGDIENCKLLLRPLSDLTKEIEHGGKKFVPIVELAKIAEMLEPIAFDAMEDFSRGQRGVCAKDRFNNQWLMFDFKNGFSMWHKPRGESEHRPTLVDSQLQLFDKLFEWHFDVFGLIDQNLAIAIND